MHQRQSTSLALRGAFETPEYVDGCRRANDGVKGEASATDACESINLKNAPEQTSAGPESPMRAIGMFPSRVSCTAVLSAPFRAALESLG